MTTNNIKSLIAGIIIGINACSTWAGVMDFEEWELNKIGCIMDVMRAKAFTLTEETLKNYRESKNLMYDYLSIADIFERYLFDLIEEQGIKYPKRLQWTEFTYYERKTTIKKEIEDLKKLFVINQKILINQVSSDEDYMLFLVGHLVNKECKDEFLSLSTMRNIWGTMLFVS